MIPTHLLQPTPFLSKGETSAIDELRLRKIITAPDWEIPAAALDESLKDWLQSQKIANPFRVITGPPFSGHAEILTTWQNLIISES